MAKVSAGCAGWGVAGVLMLALIGQCMGDPPTSNGIQPLTSTGSTEPVARMEFVQSDRLNCRADRTTSASVVERLSRGDLVRITQDQDGWSLLDRSADCWASSVYLAANSPPYQAPAPQRSYSSDSSGGSSAGSSRSRARGHPDGGICPCSGNNVCIGPRGGRYCITSGGNKRYGV